MTAQGHPGSLLIYGFEDKTPPDGLLERIADGRCGGVILFSRNLGTIDEVAELTKTLADAAPDDGPPLILSIDQEGGLVQRVKAPFPHWPAMARLGAIDDEALSSAVGRAVGEELLSIGFNVDFAPVLDVHTNPQNPVIGNRAFATEPERAAKHALSFWRGLESAGVRGCGKHFPGHGDTSTDSHHDLPTVHADAERLRRIELRPFADAIRAGVPMMMTAHVVYPAVDPEPATMSRRWLTEILREELGFDGVIVSDDLDMKAVHGRYPGEDVVRRSLAAGADSFLVCRNTKVQEEAEAALLAAAADAVLGPRVAESMARMHTFRKSLRTRSTRLNATMLAEHGRLAARITTSA